MSPTVRLARCNVELDRGAADLFTGRHRRRRVRLIPVQPVSTNGHLPEHFHQLAGLRPYDQERAR